MGGGGNERKSINQNKFISDLADADRLYKESYFTTRMGHCYNHKNLVIGQEGTYYTPCTKEQHTLSECGRSLRTCN